MIRTTVCYKLLCVFGRFFFFRRPSVSVVLVQCLSISLLPVRWLLLHFLIIKYVYCVFGIFCARLWLAVATTLFSFSARSYPEHFLGTGEKFLCLRQNSPTSMVPTVMESHGILGSHGESHGKVMEF